MDSSEQIIFFWNSFHHILALLLNITALVLLLSHWKRLGAKKELRLSYLMMVFVTMLNFLGLILVELPRLYSSWTTTPFIFGVRLCQYLWISTPIIEVFQVNFLSALIFGIWIVQRRIMRYSTNIGSHFARFLTLTFVASLSTGLIALSRVYQPQTEVTGSLQKLAILQSECPEEVQSFWIISFRWIIAFIVPIISSLIFLTHLKLKLWTKCSQVLRSYIKFCASLIFINLLIQLPALIVDICSMQSWPLFRVQSFAVKVLSVVLPKLQFSIFPVGIVTILSWKPRRLVNHATRPPRKLEMTEEDLKLLPINLSRSPTTDV